MHNNIIIFSDYYTTPNGWGRKNEKWKKQKKHKNLNISYRQTNKQTKIMPLLCHCHPCTTQTMQFPSAHCPYQPHPIPQLTLSKRIMSTTGSQSPILIHLHKTSCKANTASSALCLIISYIFCRAYSAITPGVRQTAERRVWAKQVCSGAGVIFSRWTLWRVGQVFWLTSISTAVLFSLVRLQEVGMGEGYSWSNVLRNHPSSVAAANTTPLPQ